MLSDSVCHFGFAWTLDLTWTTMLPISGQTSLLSRWCVFWGTNLDHEHMQKYYYGSVWFWWLERVQINSWWDHSALFLEGHVHDLIDMKFSPFSLFQLIRNWEYLDKCLRGEWQFAHQYKKKVKSCQGQVWSMEWAFPPLW